MADMIMPQKGGKRITRSLTLDLTPMVDLGFILITFFIFTTTMTESKVMALNIPSNEPTNTPTAFIAESTITLMPTKDHKVVYYHGALADEVSMYILPIDKIRTLLIDKKSTVSRLPSNFSEEAHKLHVLIKPNDDCKYDDVVQLLDNMNIVDVPYYALVDITVEEKGMVGSLLK